MASIYRHPKTSVYYYRRRVPDRLRSILGKTEFRISLRTKDLPEAKQQALRVAADVQRQIESAGVTTRLTHQQVVGLAADWMRHQLTEREADPPDEMERDTAADAHELSEDRPEAVLERIYGDGMVAALLTARDVGAIDEPSRARLVRRLFSNSLDLWGVLAQRAHGDYTAPASLITAPTYQPPKPAKQVATVPLLDLFDSWAAERKPVAKTRDSWRSKVQAFVTFIEHDDAAQITDEDMVRWKEELVRRGLKASTINAGYIPALSSALAFGVDNKKPGMKRNASSGVSVIAPRIPKSQGRQPFNDADAALILGDARGRKGWRRWIPLLLAYTGARVEEVAGAAAADVKQEHGVPFIDLHDEGRSLKNDVSVRRVPLHPAVIREGFLDYVHGLPKGSPLFPDAKPDKYQKRSAKVSKKLGTALRKLGITDPRKVAAHSWRHRFVDLCRAARVPKEVRFALDGHKSGDEGDEYGTGFPLAVLAEAIATLPIQG